MKIRSKVEIIIEGVKIVENFKIEKGIHEEYVENIECTSYNDEKIRITAQIESDDRNKNYLIYQDLKEYLFRLFVLFGTNVKIDESKTTIDTGSDYYEVEHVSCPPIISIDCNEILSYSEIIIKTLYNCEKNGEFYNLIEANKNIDIVHRFRSLFATFDNIAPKHNNSINYHDIKEKYVDIINLLYDRLMLTRYHEIVKELIRLNLTDINRKINYSIELEKVFNTLPKRTIINNDVAFNILKCIQIVRNQVNHGSFNGLTPKLVLGSYELLLPLVRELMKEILSQMR